MLEFAGVALLAAAVWFMWDSLQAREAANAAIRPACKARGLLFLDDTVALDRIRPMRDDNGRIKLNRVYRFEYSDTGDNRRKGSVTLLGPAILRVELNLPARPQDTTLH